MKNKIINNVLKDTDINFSEDLKAFALAVIIYIKAFALAAIICFVLAYIAQCLSFI